MLPESELWGSKKLRWADCYLCDSFSAWQAACEPGNWTGLWCSVEEVGEEVEEQEGELMGELGRWRMAPNTWDTAWLTWRSSAPTLKDWPLPVSWLHSVVCLSLNLSPLPLSSVLSHTVKLCHTFCAIGLMFLDMLVPVLSILSSFSIFHFVFVVAVFFSPPRL